MGVCVYSKLWKFFDIPVNKLHNYFAVVTTSYSVSDINLNQKYINFHRLRWSLYLLFFIYCTEILLFPQWQQTLNYYGNLSATWILFWKRLSCTIVQIESWLFRRAFSLMVLPLLIHPNHRFPHQILRICAWKSIVRKTVIVEAGVIELRKKER